MLIPKIKNTKVTILGAARSGLAAAGLLQKMGATPFVSDAAPAENKPDERKALELLAIDYEFGGHSSKVFETDFVVLSPGIPVASEVVQSLLAKKIPVYSEIEVASWFAKGGLIAVTGSNGKTTTTTLIGEMLKSFYAQSQVAGNIGSPFADCVMNTVEESWSVVEVSSFQLETINSFHPQQAVILNFAPNHLNRYPGYEEYLQAKWRITNNQTSQDNLIFNADDPKLSEWAEHFPGHKLGFSIQNSGKAAAWFDGKSIYVSAEKLIDVQQMQLRGPHNYMNAMAAALAAKNARVPLDNIRRVLQNFRGVEHRLEFVRELDGVRYVNDSKATTVEALAVALESFDAPILLITGGKDKGSDFTKLNKRIAAHVKELILIGTSSEKMQHAWTGIKQINLANSLEEALEIGKQKAESGDVVLLSPACASFDMFKDFEDRGRQFKQIINAFK